MVDWAGWLETVQVGWPIALGLCLFILVSVIVVWLLPRRRVAALGLGVDEDRRLELENEFRKTNAQVLGGIFILAGIFYTAEEISLTRQAENFKALSEAIKLLGSDNLQQELGGIHILDQVAREDSKKQRAVLSILASYVRQSTHRRADGTASQRVIETTLRVIGGLLPEVDANCTGTPFVDLSGADFTKLELVSMDLSKMNLREVKFFDAYLNDANFTCSQLNGAVFDQADLTGVDLSRAHLDDASFVRTEITGVNFYDARGWKPEQFYDSICGDQPPTPDEIAKICGTGELVSASDD